MSKIRTNTRTDFSCANYLIGSRQFPCLIVMQVEPSLNLGEKSYKTIILPPAVKTVRNRTLSENEKMRQKKRHRYQKTFLVISM